MGEMKKAARQPSACVAAPPSTGPMPLAMAKAADTSAIQRTRSRASGNRSAGAAKAVAIIMPPATPCRGAEGDQLRHGLRRQPAGDRAQRHHRHRGQHQRLAPEHVAQAPEDQDGGRGGQQVARAHPGVQGHAVQGRGHAGQGRADDGGIEGHQYHGGGHAGHGEQQVAAERAGGDGEGEAGAAPASCVAPAASDGGVFMVPSA